MDGHSCILHSAKPLVRNNLDHTSAITTGWGKKVPAMFGEGSSIRELRANGKLKHVEINLHNPVLMAIWRRGHKELGAAFKVHLRLVCIQSL